MNRNKSSTRYYSSKQEKEVAEKVKGKVTPNSGATSWQKGDININGQESFLLECKTKTSNSNSISIKKEWIDKNREEAAFMGKKHQVIVFNFGPDYPYSENHYIIDEYLFNELKDYLNEKYT
jgi:hypothetical protein